MQSALLHSAHGEVACSYFFCDGHLWYS